MVHALVTRRFNVRRAGVAVVVEAARVMELPALPLHGYVLVFADGSGEAGISAMRMHAWPSPRPAGVYPVGVEIRTGAEPGAKLAAALAAGWQEVSDGP